MAPAPRQRWSTSSRTTGGNNVVPGAIPDGAAGVDRRRKSRGDHRSPYDGAAIMICRYRHRRPSRHPVTLRGQTAAPTVFERRHHRAFVITHSDDSVTRGHPGRGDDTATGSQVGGTITLPRRLRTVPGADEHHAVSSSSTAIGPPVHDSGQCDRQRHGGQIRSSVAIDGRPNGAALTVNCIRRTTVARGRQPRLITTNDWAGRRNPSPGWP